MRQSRSICIDGKLFILPPRLYRPNKFYWRVSYSKNKEKVVCNFLDSKYGGIEESFNAAMRYLTLKILPIIYGLPTVHEKNRQDKQSDTPVGITGPIWRTTNNSSICVFNVVVPVVGKTSEKKIVYIGTENTYMSNYSSALQKAIKIRDKAVEDYKREGQRLRLEAVYMLDTEISQ